MATTESLERLYSQTRIFNLGEKQEDSQLESVRQARRRINAIRHRFGHDLAISIMGSLGAVGGFQHPDHQKLLKQIIWHGQNANNNKLPVHQLIQEGGNFIARSARNILRLLPGQDEPSPSAYRFVHQ